MNERELLKEFARDLQSAAAGRRRVLYLEGKTDVPILLALLGARDERAVSNAVLYDGVVIRGLGGGGSGSSAVAQRLAVASGHHYPGIFGVIDGDGEALERLTPQFDGPHPGPRFRWKTYCIENLLARACWPAEWGTAPDWREVMHAFAPYVAMNRIGLELRQRLNRLGLDRFQRPGLADDLVTAQQVRRRLREGKQELTGLDVEAMFSAELEHFQAVLATSVDEAHALLNGKWLVEVYAPRCTKLSPDACREAWTGHLREIGGDPEIHAWWQRTIAPSVTDGA